MTTSPVLQSMTVTRDAIITAGMIYRNAYGEDMVITRVRKLRGGGRRVEMIMHILDHGTGQITLKRINTKWEYGTLVTFNRSV